MTRTSLVFTQRIGRVAAVFALGTTLSTATHATPIVSDDPVLYWSQVIADGAAGPPQYLSRNAAIASVAVYDAVNATKGYKDRPYFGRLVAAGGDTRAATAQAAHDVLVALQPGDKAKFDADLAASLALVTNEQAKAKGIATGAAFAAAALSARAGDGTGHETTYVPTGAPGNYVVTPGLPPGFNPIGTDTARTTPFLLAAPDQFRPGPPPSLGSAEYAAALNLVKAIGAANSTTRTQTQTDSAIFINSQVGTTPWLRAGIAVAQGKHLSSLQLAADFARLSAGTFDAVISSFDAKYAYDLWRPITAITRADTDGNPLTVADPNWTPLLFTPPFPSYTSAHSTVAGAAGAILAGEFGNANHFCLDGVNSAGAATECWNSFGAAAQETSDAREWGGIHFRFDDQAGLAAGAKVGAWALGSGAFSAVPEPGAFALLGAGAIGLLMARRRQ